MSVLLIANIGTTASEFSGIATSFEIFGISKYVAVPIMLKRIMERLKSSF